MKSFYLVLLRPAETSLMRWLYGNDFIKRAVRLAVANMLHKNNQCKRTSGRLRTTVHFVTSHLEIFHCTHHPVIHKSNLYFTLCSTLNALSKRTSK